jgi:quercetin dioxygenase-like cupin family protein
MTTNTGRQDLKLDRRTLLLMGVAGATALTFGNSGETLAGEAKAPAPEVKDVTIKEGKPVDSMIPGFSKVRFREFTFKPGGRTKATMVNPMICECSQGTLEVTQDGKSFTAKKGHLWTCNQGTVEETVNKGKTVAIMRVFDVLKG